MEDETTDNTDFTEESTDNLSNLKELDIIGNIFGPDASPTSEYGNFSKQQITNKLNKNGDIIVIGQNRKHYEDVYSPINDGTQRHSGYVAVYKYNENNWEQLGDYLQSDGQTTPLLDEFGVDVDINSSGNRIVTLKYGINETRIGYVEVYEYDNVSWNLVGEPIEILGLFVNSRVSINSDGNRIFVFCSHNTAKDVWEPGIDQVNYEGRIKLYELQDGSWVKIANDIAGKPDSGEIYADPNPNFMSNGYAFNDQGNRIAIQRNAFGGGVEVLELKDNEWVQLGEPIYVVDGDEDGIRYSCDFAMNGDIIAISTTIALKTYKYENETWMQYGGDIPNPDLKSGHRDKSGLLQINKLGTRVAIHQYDGDYSYLRIYDLIENTWVEVIKPIAHSDETSWRTEVDLTKPIAGTGKMSLNESGDRLSVSDRYWSMEYNTDTPQLSEYEGRVVVYHLSNITEEEPINEEEEVVEEPINEEEEEVVEEPTNEEEEEVVEEPVNCCEDYDTSTWVTTDVDLGGGIINDKNGIGGKVTQTGKLCWNKVLYTDASLPTPYECPFESDDENDLWKNGGLVIDLKFNLTKDLELVFVASSGECYRGVISSTEPGPHIFTKISDQSSFDPDELKSQEDLQEIGDVELDDQPQNDSDDSNESDDVDETLYVEDCECSVSFDGKTGSYVNVPYLEKPSSITVALYFKITSHDNLRVGDGDPASQFLLFQQNSRTDVNNGSFYIKYQEQTDTQGKLVIGCASSEGTSVEISTSDNFITLNENYMIHATFGDDAVTLYVNGEEIDSKSKDFILDYHNEHTIHLGRKRAVGDDTDAFFVGNIYSFYVYAKELSAEYIKSFFNKYKCGEVILPTITPTLTPSTSPTHTITPTHTHTITPTPTLTPIPDGEDPIPTHTRTITPTITNTPSFTNTPTKTPSITETPTITPSPSVTDEPVEVGIMHTIFGKQNGEVFGLHNDVNREGTRIVASAHGANNNKGLFRVYNFNGTEWIQQGSDVPGETSNESFGSSVRITSNGDKVIAGAPIWAGNGTATGTTRAYKFNGSSWNNKLININGMIVGDNVGINCDISSDGSCFLVKGAKGTNTTGQSYAWFKIFEFKSGGGGVTQLGETLKYPRSEFGMIDQASLNATGDRLLIGNSGHETTTNDLGWLVGNGKVMVYEYKDSTWTQIGQDVIGTGSANFGLSCRLNSSGNRFIAGGAVADDTKGYVEIYELIDSTWTLMGQRINGVQGGAMFGSVVDIDDDGNRVCVSSASYDHSGKERVGRTQVYDWNGSAWIEVYDIIGETAQEDLGNRCSLSGDGNRLVVASDDSNRKGKLTIHQLPKKLL